MGHEYPTPGPIDALAVLDPEFHAGYVTSRNAVMKERAGGLAEREKEIVLLTLDVARGNRDAALFHAKRAIDLGASPRALLDAIELSFLVAGASTWGITGQFVYEEAYAYAEAGQAQT